MDENENSDGVAFLGKRTLMKGKPDASILMVLKN